LSGGLTRYGLLCSVLEGIALVGNPDFAIVDEAYPFVAKRLLTDDSPRLRAALQYMVPPHCHALLWAHVQNHVVTMCSSLLAALQ
jgi:predicted unusual protein kinase regulating ubiquinone biosynthesis (AarF/ABC1/UbiB family)